MNSLWFGLTFSSDIDKIVTGGFRGLIVGGLEAFGARDDLETHQASFYRGLYFYEHSYRAIIAVAMNTKIVGPLTLSATSGST